MHVGYTVRMLVVADLVFARYAVELNGAKRGRVAK
jgi:hypothetical protein